MFYVAVRDDPDSIIWKFYDGTLFMPDALSEYAQAVRLYGKLRVNLFTDVAVNVSVSAKLIKPETWGMDEDGVRE